MPGVSRKTTCPSGSVRMPAMRLRVVCGLGVTIATLAPTRALSSVDLPTFGRPTMAAYPVRWTIRSRGADERDARAGGPARALHAGPQAEPPGAAPGAQGHGEGDGRRADRLALCRQGGERRRHGGAQRPGP